MINSFYQSQIWCLKKTKKWSANLNGPSCKIMKSPYMMVPQTTTGHQPQQGRCPKLVTHISYSFYRILGTNYASIQNFSKIGWKTKKLRLHPFFRRRFVRKWKCLKLVIFKDSSIKSLCTRQDNAIGYFFVYQIHAHDFFFSKPKDSLFYSFPIYYSIWRHREDN